MKNLAVNLNLKTHFRRFLIHESVSYLKNELKFDIYSLVFNFISKDEILEINKKYLGHDYITDVITFNYSETNSPLDGEIYICYDEVVRNAQKFSCSVETEAVRMVTHGILHLLGYDDQKARDKRVMKKIENELVNKQQKRGLYEH